MKKTVFLLGALLMVYWNGATQSVSGNWFGIGKVDLPSTSNTYLTELILTQKGKSITGYLQYYFRDSLFHTPITGNFDAATRRLTLNPFSLIHHSSTNTSTGIDCPMNGEFILRVSKVESVLTGSFYSNKDYRFTCPSIQLKLKLENPETAVEPSSTTSTSPNAQEDSIKPVKPIVSIQPSIKDTTPTTPIDTVKQKEYEKREKQYLKIIEVTESNLRLEFYDNGAIDYDEIAVFFNNKLILPKTLLTHKAIRLKVTMDDNLPYNELSMFAESVGTTPPNTAALIIYDGAVRHDVILTSDFNKTATIKLVKKKTN